MHEQIGIIDGERLQITFMALVLVSRIPHSQRYKWFKY